MKESKGERRRKWQDAMIEGIGGGRGEKSSGGGRAHIHYKDRMACRRKEEDKMNSMRIMRMTREQMDAALKYNLGETGDSAARET